MQHDFYDSMERAEALSAQMPWKDIFRRAFPGLRAAIRHRSDGWGQRSGIDWTLTLDSSKVITVDEKVRDKDWPDILLEYCSIHRSVDDACTDSCTAGWVAKPLACDFIAYAMVPYGRCFFLPTLTLQRAWAFNEHTWQKEYFSGRAKNKGYVTRFTCVPTGVLMKAMVNAMVVGFEISNELQALLPPPKNFAIRRHG